jgi:hypothetical protein
MPRNPGDEGIILENMYAYAGYDQNPVSSGYLFLIRKRHFSSHSCLCSSIPYQNHQVSGCGIKRY